LVDSGVAAVSVIERLLGREASSPVPTSGDTGLNISRLRRRDLRNGVMAIEAASYPRPWSRGVFDSEIEQMKSGSRHYVVGRRGRTIVGYAGLWFAADEAHVTNVAVNPGLYRTGIASQLLLVQAAEAIRRKCPAWTLEVRVSSVGAQELYRHFGFSPAGIRKNYYENTEDAIVMWCTDIQGADYAARLDQIRERLA
jgi:ribosomal-protein-alanine N-acetyltransferase